MWQYSKLVKCPLENRHFASYMGKRAVFIWHVCIYDAFFHINTVLFWRQQADYGHQLRQKAFVLSRRVLRTYVSDPQINFAKPAEN